MSKLHGYYLRDRNGNYVKLPSTTPIQARLDAESLSKETYEVNPYTVVYTEDGIFVELAALYRPLDL